MPKIIVNDLKQYKLIFKMASISDTSCLALLIIFFTTANELTPIATSSSPVPESSSLKLNCTPGDTRLFKYDSFTKFWGNSSQIINLSADIRIHCMEVNDKSMTLKYFVEIVDLVPHMIKADGTTTKNPMQTTSRLKPVSSLSNQKKQSSSSNYRLNPSLASSAQFRHMPSSVGDSELPTNEDLESEGSDPKVEPLLEELEEISIRVKRSVSGWLSNTWDTMRDFFDKIFKSTDGPEEISPDSPDGKFNLDGPINQCKSKSGQKGRGSLPFDESIFDDLNPNFKIEASREHSASPPGSIFDQGADEISRGVITEGINNNKPRETSDGDDEESNNLSFFDKPTIVRPHQRLKRSDENQLPNNSVYFKLPFEFIQSLDGKIVDIKFSSKETDLSIKNFKKHICDLFATHLDRSKPSQSELTPVGRHTTKYYYDDGDGRVLQQSLHNLSSSGSTANGDGPLLTRVLAVVGVERDSYRPSVLEDAGDEKIPQAPSKQNGGPRVAIIRDINSTDSIQFGSQAIVHDMSQFRIQVKQIQQISSNQMISTAGQLSMSLVRPIIDNKKEELFETSNRYKRQTNTPSVSIGVGLNENLDMANLLQVTTSFSMQLSSSPSQSRIKRDSSATVASEIKSNEFKTTIEKLKKMESELKMVSTGMMAESDEQDGRLQRLELLRDQVVLRLNEEATMRMRDRKPGEVQYDEGLGLTQIILDSGRTNKIHGSIYPAIEEIIELEFITKQDKQPHSMSRLLRETIKFSRLKSYCKQALPLIRSDEPNGNRESYSASSIGNNIGKNNNKKLDRCRQVLQLLLRVNAREAIDLNLDLIDDCNRQLSTNLKHEEIGHNQGGRYYRHIRQQFIELLTNVGQPGESLLDKLMSRLHYNFVDGSGANSKKQSAIITNGANFNGQGSDYTFLSSGVAGGGKKEESYRKNDGTPVKNLDDTNNNDGDGSMVMTITSLAAKSSVSQSKRIEIGTKLLNLLRNTTCSLHEGPDLDILESIGNFDMPIPEIVPKIVHLSRRCRLQDQYIVACIHASQGQLQSNIVQKWFSDTLKAANTTCMVKSEIVAELIAASSMNDLMSSALDRRRQVSEATGSSGKSSAAMWPYYGLNQVDNTLLDLMETDSNARKCLKKYVEYYMRNKHPKFSRSESLLTRLEFIRNQTNSRQVSNNQARPTQERSINNNRSLKPSHNYRYKRYIARDFWDDASCKRWNLGLPQDGVDSNEIGTISNEVENNIVASLDNVNRASTRKPSRRKNGLLLLEREDPIEPPPLPNNSNVSSRSYNSSVSTVSRRQKCTGIKTYGPRNAQATVKAEIVNDLIGPKEDNKFLARFTLATDFLGSKVDIGRMYLWHQRQTTRAYVNMFGKTLWDTSHSCQDKTPRHLMYMPLFDFNIWVVKINVGIRLHSEMGFHSNCPKLSSIDNNSKALESEMNDESRIPDELELFPTISVRASGEASAKFAVARAGMSVGSHYSYRGEIRVSRKPESCMSISSGHEPMNVTFSSWYQFWDNDCHYWGSRTKGEPHAVKWSLNKRRATTWVSNECLGPAENRSSTFKIEP